ncbi:hypothetical protein BD414DRAFT_484750 [Trametes punicea]|nr:hypothetical protein BD414DRAFT_484750 [Trametes punicea]
MQPEPLSPLQRLNDDVFGYLVEELVSQESLLSLSQTCKQIRFRCLPTLFRAYTVRVWMPITEEFVPRALWPHIRSLTLKDECPDTDALPMHPMSSRARPLISYSKDPLLCGVLDGAVLARTLRAMPRLCSVTLLLRDPSPHGVPWSAVQAFLDVPQLNSFTCDGYLFAPVSTPTPLFLVNALPLRSFQYKLDVSRYGVRMRGPEQDALAVVLQACRQSLEYLALPSEPAPLQTLASLHWPCLRELTLDGELPLFGDPASPTLLSVLGNMPKLRVLCLRLALPSSTTPLPIWPKDLAAVSCPWPDLERLQVSFPRVDDELYAHLSPALRSLSLRYYPHSITYLWQERRPGWQFPPSSCRDIFRILSSSQFPELEELEVEYHDDGSEESLLHYIGVAFPKLRSLKILRYRLPDTAEFDIEAWGRHLRPFKQLRTLSIHLDLPATPPPIEGTFYIGFGDWLDEVLRTFNRALDEAANALVGALGESVEQIRMLRPYGDLSREWAVYRIDRGSSDDGFPVACYDRVLTYGEDLESWPIIVTPNEEDSCGPLRPPSFPPDCL